MDAVGGSLISDPVGQIEIVIPALPLLYVNAYSVQHQLHLRIGYNWYRHKVVTVFIIGPTVAMFLDL